MNLLCFLGFHKEPKRLIKSYDKLGYTLTKYKCKRCKQVIESYKL